jgi:TonB family protein
MEKVNTGFLPSLAVWRSIRLRNIAVILLALFALVSSHPALAQESRKLRTSVQPLYPELAKLAHMYGTTRLEVLIARDGTIKDIKVLGGSPLLVRASVDAVKQWKYEAGPSESTIILRFDFKP